MPEILSYYTIDLNKLHTPKKTDMHITRLLNAVLCTENFPQILKHANIFLIHKNNKPPIDPQSYRPISLLELFWKLLENSIKYRFTNHIEGRQFNTI